MKSSFHSLIPFLPLFCNCRFRRLDSAPKFISWQAGISKGDSIFLNCTLLYSNGGWTTQKIAKYSIFMATSYDMTPVMHLTFWRSPVENALTILFDLTLFQCLGHFTFIALLESHWLIHSPRFINNFNLTFVVVTLCFINLESSETQCRVVS
jgi:hypothetical protein